MLASFPVKSLISASSTLTTTPSPIDAALPVIWALVWIVPPPSESAKVDVGVGVALAAGLLRLHLITARCAAGSCSITSTVR